MTIFINSKMRGVAIVTGVVLLASAIVQPTVAQADEKKEKTYKTGAAVLGALGAYFILKGKTVPGAAAAAGAYYAYKKSKEVKNEGRNDDRYGDGRYDDRYEDERTSDDDYYSSRNDDDRYSNDDRYDGTWSTPGSRRADNRYPDYSGIASGKTNKTSAAVLK